MPNFICTTRGTQLAATDRPPAECTICTDERQFVGWNGQQWSTLDDLRESHRIVVRLEEAGLYGIVMEPSFAIGQRALLITHPKGNVLWDCIPLIGSGLDTMLVWVLADNPFRQFYGHFGGKLVDEREIEIGEKNFGEVAYGWDDVAALLREENAS